MLRALIAIITFIPFAIINLFIAAVIFVVGIIVVPFKMFGVLNSEKKYNQKITEFNELKKTRMTFEEWLKSDDHETNYLLVQDKYADYKHYLDTQYFQYYEYGHLEEFNRKWGIRS